jgi:hypothetical protein
VFLRVWQDECENINGRLCARIRSKSNATEDRLGRTERQEHITQIREGATSYMIMCRARDPNASPREIAGFNKNDIFIGGAIIEKSGHTWLELADRKPVTAARVSN